MWTTRLKITLVMVIAFFLTPEGRKMFDKGAGSYNPGIDFTNTSMTSEYANSFKADELGIDQSIEHVIDRINDMPEMDGKPDDTTMIATQHWNRSLR